MPPVLRSLLILIALLATHLAGAAPFVWNVASPAANNWNVDANWLPGAGNPGVADTAIFAATGTSGNATTVNNVVSVNTAVASLVYSNIISGQWHVTSIPAGVTLTVTNGVTIGGQTSDSIVTAVAMTDGGILIVSGGNYVVGNSGTNAFQNSTNDISGLSAFIYSNSAGSVSFGAANRSGASVNLASSSNRIIAATMNNGTGSTSNGGTSNTRLGGGTNIIHAGTLNIAAGRETCNFVFQTTTGGLRVRGVGGTDSDRANMTVGNHNTGGSGSTAAGNLLFNGHPVDLKLGTVNLGQSTSAPTGNSFGNGTIQFDTGTIDATAINMGISSGTTTFVLANGTIAVGAGGTLIVGAGGVSLVNQAAASGAASGTLGIGGTATCAGNIIKTTTAGTGTITVTNGSLAVSGTMGSASAPIDNVNLTNATLTLRSGVSAPNIATTLNTGGTTNVINISTVPSITSYPAQFQVVKYSGAIGGAGFDNNVGLGTLPPSTPPFAGFLSNNTTTSTIDLVVTAGPQAAQPVTWTGLIDGDWDTAKLNWRAGLAPTNYNNAGDFVTFDDAGLNTTVSLVTPTLTPGSITVSNNIAAYTFTGSGKLSGSTGLTKLGTGTLILENSGVNDFNGNISLTGTLQVGTGSTNGNLPVSGNVANNGTLNFNRSDNFTLGNAISGAGALTKDGTNTLTLTGANSFAGGLNVNRGVIRLNAVNSGGSGTITVSSPTIGLPSTTVVFGAAQTNAGIVLAGGTFGSSLNLNPLVSNLTAAPGTISLLYMADPQNLTPADGNETAFTGTWHGSGNVIVATVINDPSPDGGNGFRLRGTAASDFSGTLTLSNSVKGELQTSVAGPFSPAGSGKLVLYGGVLTNNTVNGNYTELNLRNNSVGATVFGNNVELAGTGLAVLDPLGSAPAGTTITMGNLKIGGGQELGVNLNGTGPDHPVVFQSVTLTGGNATFSPKTIGWNTTPQIGSDLSLADIGQTTASSITMNGLRTLFLTGTSTYTGSTTVSNGTLHVSGALNGGGAVTVAGGTLMGNGSTAGALTVHPVGTLAAGASVGKFTAGGSVTLQGTNVMEIDRTAGTNDVLQGGSVIAYGGTLVISNLTDPLQAGDSFKLYNASSYSGSFNAIIPNVPGAGLVWNTSNLITNGTLKVASAFVPRPYISSIAVSGTNIIVSGTNQTAGGNYYVLTSTNITLAVANWTSILTQSFNGVNFSFTNSFNPAESQRFFLLQLP
jgi:autotransporter-associated beta strand protein